VYLSKPGSSENSAVEVENASRSHRYLDGVRWTLVTNIAGSGFSFLSAIVIARLLDPAGYGTYRTITYLVGFCAAVAGFELRDALRRFIPTCRVQKPEEADAAILAACCIVGAFSLAIAVALGCFGDRVAVSLYKQPSLAGPLRWSGLLVAAVAGAAVMEAALTGLELYKTATMRSFITQSVALPVQILLAYRFGVTGALWGFGILLASRAFFLGGAVLHACGRGLMSPAVFRHLGGMCKVLMGFSLPLLVTALLIPFANWWLSARLAVTAGMHEVGTFAVAYGLIQLLTTIALAAGVPLMPLLAQASASADHDTMVRMVSRGSRMITLLLFLPAFAVGANARAIILLLYGHRFAGAAPVLFMLSLACLPLAINEGLGRSLVATGKIRFVVAGHLVWVIIILSAVEFYGRWHGAQGCAQSFIAAEMSQTIYLVLVFYVALRYKMHCTVKTFAICSLAMIPAYYQSSAALPLSLCLFVVTTPAVLAALWKWSLTEPDRAIISDWLINLRHQFAT
jgi:O-antigen/teichoic acid export membrane protein